MYHLEIRGNGSGPAFLFVHGVLADRRCWDPLVKQAPSDARLLLVDLPDSGQASDERCTQLRVLEDALVACAGRAGEGELTLVGHCLGAHLSARLLAPLAQRVSRAVLIAGYAGLPEEHLDDHLDAMGALQSGTVTLDELREEALERWLGEDGDEEHERIVEQVFGSLSTDRAIRAMRRLLATSRSQPPAWEIPTVVIHGREDEVVPFQCGEELAERGRRCELVALDTDSHLPQVTHAAELAPLVFGSD